MKMLCALMPLVLTMTAARAATAPVDAPPAAASDHAGPAGLAPTRPKVRLGMSPESVAKAIGRPDKQETVKTAKGEALQWTYRRLQKEWTDQVAATVAMVPGFVGGSLQHQALGEVATPGNQTMHISVYQVSSLLFVDGKLVAAKQWPEKEVRTEN